MKAGGPDAPELNAILNAGECIDILKEPSGFPVSLANELDRGEASVIHIAESRNIERVAIDEKAGRRVARLHNLKVTGSVGILIRARKMGLIGDLNEYIENMRNQGVWLSEAIVAKARKMKGNSS